jgi:riboflavin synthase
MFTGIVEETGTVRHIAPSNKSIRLGVLASVCGRGTKVGDSVAVNGCCLTVVRARRSGGAKLLDFDLLRETWQRTNLRATKLGGVVNLERSLRGVDRMGGHFVTGHIDGTGKIRRWEPIGADWVLDVDVPVDLMRYLVFKGAVALDGISLTVAEVTQRGFRIWIIPHTYEVTALRERQVGDLVNIEVDLLGKYVERFLALQDRSLPKRPRVKARAGAA